ncbi:AAA family ATPase [Novipirellula sp. SH528]|uniref:AAA family ATPase n=1 Tax=Novipirellula sp. SH528 TaxID=3454466 RepID=UPI003FA0551D
MEYLGWLLVGLLMGGGISYIVTRCIKTASHDRSTVAALLHSHFHPIKIDSITISEREFPFRVRADLQRAIDRLFGDDTEVLHFCGVRKEYSHEGVSLADCVIESEHYPPVSIPPEFEEIDIGDETPVRVLKVGLWLLEKNQSRFAVLLTPTGQYGQITGMKFQVGTPNSPEGTKIAQSFFKHLEEAILKAESYRGKTLSLEQSEHSYTGQSTGITVHKLRLVERENVILPESTLKLLERNVIQFVQQRERLSKFKQSTKKGILFYGPPGTGKTHTIHYLSRALEDHTTLLISAEQVGLLSEYMTLARLLQPSMVVLEDVDLIARDRANMNSPCDEILLNKLLNEMDGLKQDADILFILTTNRPESLEAALASRPGRIDQAIEFPLPNDSGRNKLIRLYSEGISLSDEVVADVVRRTEGVSAAFIKELMRRSVQFHIERNGSGEINSEDVSNALDEMLVSGGSLNLKLLGASGIE